jgi:hypothetical protein
MLGCREMVLAHVVNDAVGRFARWRFPDAPDRMLLPGT